MSGCPAGRGEGWVLGELYVENCKDGRSLDGEFDLKADFYAGDPVFDSSQSAVERQSRLFIRIQETSNIVSESNSLTFQFQDMVKAAQAFNNRELLTLTDDSLIPNSSDVNAALRGQLQLYTSCPDNNSPLHAIGWPLLEQQTNDSARDEICMLPQSQYPSPPVLTCPQLDDATRDELDAICAEPDFNDRESKDRIEAILGKEENSACLYLCSLGSLKRGQDPKSLLGFEIDFGDSISALFVSKLVDGRAIRLGQCARAWGRLVGRFRFNVIRSRVAQPFP